MLTNTFIFFVFTTFYIVYIHTLKISHIWVRYTKWYSKENSVKNNSKYALHKERLFWRILNTKCVWLIKFFCYYYYFIFPYLPPCSSPSQPRYATSAVHGLQGFCVTVLMSNALRPALAKGPQVGESFLLLYIEPHRLNKITLSHLH